MTMTPAPPMDAIHKSDVPILMLTATTVMPAQTIPALLHLVVSTLLIIVMTVMLAQWMDVTRSPAAHTL